MKLFNVLTAAVLAVPIAFSASTASAVTFAGSVVGEFTSQDAENTGPIPFFGAFGAEISGDKKELTWPGQSCVLFTCFDPVLTDTSTLTINDGGFGADLSFGESKVGLFSITWKNAASLSITTDDLFDAFATFDIAYTQPGVANGSEEVRFSIENTNNPAGDNITPSLTSGPLDFDLDVPLYLSSEVSITGYHLKEVGAGMFTQGIWSNPEGGVSTLVVSAKVDVVPLPAAGWLLLAGVGGLAAMKRRKKA